MNERYGNTTVPISANKLQRLVVEEGIDAAAEERIVFRAVSMLELPNRGWFNTESLRHRIRKLQGRKRRENDS